MAAFCNAKVENGSHDSGVLEVPVLIFSFRT